MNVYVYVCACMYVIVCKCMFVQVCIFTCARVRVCVCVCVCVLEKFSKNIISSRECKYLLNDSSMSRVLSVH